MPGDDNFALIDIEALESSDRGFRVESVHFRLDEPALGPGDGRLAPLPPPGHLRGVDGSVAYHAVKPGDGIGRRPTLASELDECLLHNVFRLGAPLTGAQHQRR